MCSKEMLEQLKEDLKGITINYKENRCVAILFQQNGPIYLSISGYNFDNNKLVSNYEYIDNNNNIVSGAVYSSKEWNTIKNVVSKVFNVKKDNMKYRNLHCETPTKYRDFYYSGNVIKGKSPSKNEIDFGVFFKNECTGVRDGKPMFAISVKRLFSCAERKLDRLLCEKNGHAKKLIISKNMCDLCSPFISKWKKNNAKIIV